MIPPLYPLEILKRILYHVTDRQDLAECNRVNTTWRQVSNPFLYERFQLKSWFSDEATAHTFLQNDYGRHVKHLTLNMALLEDPQRPSLRPVQIQRRTSSLRRKGFKLFPGCSSATTEGANNENKLVEQRRSSLIDIISPSLQQQQQLQPPQQKQKQQKRHVCFILLEILQSCKYVETVVLDFHERTFNMSRNAVFLFSQWQPTTLHSLHLMHLTRLITTPHLNTLKQWVKQRKLSDLFISHCVATFFAKQQQQQQQQNTTIDFLSGITKIEISALSLWDPVSATNVLPDILWPTSLKTLSILDSPDWLHQSDHVFDTLPSELDSLTLAITPNPPPSASFFLLQQPSYHGKCQGRFDQGLCQVLARCPQLKELSVEGFPTLSDTFLIYLWKRMSTQQQQIEQQCPLRKLQLVRNDRLSGQDLVDMILLDRKGCFATDRIDFSQNPKMDCDFLRCVKLTSNYAALTW
ncbi:hypothetical protein BDA99DRAFT_528482 [Phascolomyces articulosus]|uniref:F-box domain-containing protein n=1 Tax=Phascolomyces articulosus TaxID=60185 RepID=A0AAD5JM22_9FUNG|nr:hypothetical protein BDA99DRAFT_528482 [Phascolomyces articulosus]